MAQPAVRPFRINVPDEALVDLRRRILATRWPDKETVPDQSQGAQLAKIQALVRYWGTDYDWRKVEATLNALPQRVAAVVPGDRLVVLALPSTGRREMETQRARRPRRPCPCPRDARPDTHTRATPGTLTDPRGLRPGTRTGRRNADRAILWLAATRERPS